MTLKPPQPRQVMVEDEGSWKVAGVVCRLVTRGRTRQDEEDIVP